MVNRILDKAREALKGNQSLIPTNFIDKLEDVVHGFLGILLFVIATLATFFTSKRLIETHPFFPTGMIQGINDILLVVIILEIMRTVVVRFTDGIFQLDSFLIIGVIAAIRHTLTVGAALTMEKDKLGPTFNRSLYEMGVNTGIVLALVFALFLSRSARKAKA
ncbi:MAG: phosphate-starvation-inducible PsiE family protein [Actinomycetota bacterium]